MAHRLSDDQISVLWGAWLERQSIAYVSKVCSVSPTTVRKYRRDHHWDQRLREIKQKARELSDETEAERRSRLAKVGKELIDGGLAFLRTNGYQTARAAVMAVVKGIEIQRNVLGCDDDSEGNELRLIVETVDSDSLQFASREALLNRLSELDNNDEAKTNDERIL